MVSFVTKMQCWKRVGQCALILLLFAVPALVQAQTNAPDTRMLKRILVVMANAPYEAPYDQVLYRFQDELSSSKDFRFDYQLLIVEQNDYLTERDFGRYQERIAEGRFDAILGHEFPATAFILNRRDVIPKETAILFTDAPLHINETLYDRERNNFIGTYKVFPGIDNARLARKLFPERNHFILIYDESEHASRLLWDQFRDQIRKEMPDVHVHTYPTIVPGVDYDIPEREIAAIPNAMLFIESELGISYKALRFVVEMRNLDALSDAPRFFMPLTNAFSSLGGARENTEYAVRYVAKTFLEHLKNNDKDYAHLITSGIPVSYVFYSDALKRFNVDPTVLPQNEFIYDHAASVDDLVSQKLNTYQYRALFIAIPFVLLLFIFVAITVIFHIRNNALKQQRVKERAMLEHAKKMEKAKTYFLASMSHEIRTPLNSILGFAELLEEGSLDPGTRADYIHDIREAGRTLLTLINDILDLSKLESGNETVTAILCDFRAICGKLASLFKQQMQNKHLQFVQSIDSMPMLYLNRQRVTQILLNLIGNAIKFTAEGSVTVNAHFVRNDDETGNLIFSVIDTGIGINEKDQKAVFNPFTQADAPRGTRTQMGTGLGLAICQEMAGRMNGTITVHSEPNKGSCFTVTLNDVQYKYQAREMYVSTDTTRLSVVRDHAQLKILLVDDVPMNLKVLSALIRKTQASVVSSSSVDDALEHLDETRFDYIFTDLWMPGRNGEELARAVRDNAAFNGIKIYAVTADTENAQTFDISVFDGVITKPVSMDKLLAILNKSEA